jgi:hypothetical protein
MILYHDGIIESPIVSIGDHAALSAQRTFLKIKCYIILIGE